MNDTLGFHLLDRWLFNIRQGKRINQFFEDNLYTNVAIYGFGLIGKQVMSELRGTGVEVSYFIDKRSAELKNSEYLIIHPDEMGDFVNVQAIIVTPFDCYYEIENELRQRVRDSDTDVFSISNIVEYVSVYGRN